MQSTPREADVPKAVSSLEGLQAEKLELKRPEDEQEKTLRLHKESGVSTSRN